MSQSPTRIESIKKEKLNIRQNNSGPQTQSMDFIRPATEKNGNAKKSIRLGVCAMEKKITCKPMQEILKRLNATDDITTILFPEILIFKLPIQEWPIVDCLITFHSTGFPLSKAEAYIDLRKPYLINELKFQDSLLWRHKVYDILVQHGIPVAKHFVFIDQQTAKFHKQHKSNTNLCNLEEYSNSTPSNSIVKGLSKTLEFDPLETQFESKFSNNKDSLSDKESSPTLSKKASDTPPFFQEEEKLPDPESLSRKHSQTSIPKITVQDSKIESTNLRRKYSENDYSLKTSKNESFFDDSQSIQEPCKSPLNNYFRKYYTKIEEHDDFILIGDQKLKKPFVEKPLSAEDHRINIYYPKCDGGGCKCLFRKTNNVSSSFDPNSNQIRDGSFIYEEFLPTDGFDIKVYTVGPNYAHAETRKSPVLDGVVQRTKDGKEVRFPVNLTQQEKIIAKKIVFAFDQQICGFDLLRSKGKSYVCDVNGWSFVKGNQKYYTDCATLIRGMILAKFAPERLTPLNSILSQLNTNKSDNSLDNLFQPTHERIQCDKEELRSVVAIFRHGDRTPKQKMKMITQDPRFLVLFEDQPDKRKEVKVKTVKQMQQILDTTEEIIEGFYASNFRLENYVTAETISKHFQLYSVLKKGGHFEGINRKIQLTPLEWEQVPDPNGGEPHEVVKKGLLILKWGGELTHSGMEQAEELGAMFRNQVYPQDNEGLLRLHSTYRHDLKIY